MAGEYFQSWRDHLAALPDGAMLTVSPDRMAAMMTEVDGLLRDLREATEACSDLAMTHAAVIVANDRHRRREDQAAQLLETTLILLQHGERAPGGNETWVQFARRAEAFLRARIQAPACPGAEGEERT